MKITILAALTLTTAFAFARGPAIHIEPGPVQDLDASAVEALNALTQAKSEDLATFLSGGNEITEATVQHWQPGVTAYTFKRQTCTSGIGRPHQCLSGVTLEVDVRDPSIGESTSQILPTAQ